MKSFLIALQFLTIIPVRFFSIEEKTLGRATAYFPVVGLMLGIALAGISSLLYFLRFENISADIILVVSLIILTGGLHLDGLSDTSDGLYGGKNKEDILSIMRDSHTGSMGVMSQIISVLLKIAFLQSIGFLVKPYAIVLMCLISRWAMVFSMFYFPYARPDGKAKAFFEKINLKIFFIATLFTIIPMILLKNSAIIVFIFVAVSVFLINRYIKNKIDGLTGDTLGAICEISEMLVLFSFCIIERSGISIY